MNVAFPHPPIRAALFDLDGTLIETHIDFPAMTGAMLARADEAGVDPERLHGLDILGIVDRAALILRERSENAVEFRRQAFQILEAMEVAGCANPVLLPGTRECLEDLRHSGVAVGIVTRNCRAVSARMLMEFALPHGALLTRDDVALTKPNPEHLWEALSILGSPASESVMVGDHWMDVRAGKAAGCAATVGVSGKNAPEHFAPCPPDFCIPDLSALRSALTDLRSGAR